jgi:hypothetical protein
VYGRDAPGIQNAPYVPPQLIGSHVSEKGLMVPAAARATSEARARSPPRPIALAISITQPRRCWIERLRRRLDRRCPRVWPASTRGERSLLPARFWSGMGSTVAAGDGGGRRLCLERPDLRQPLQSRLRHGDAPLAGACASTRMSRQNQIGKQQLHADER